MTDNDEPVDDLPQKQQEAILALLSETSIAKAASKIGASEKTVRRWLEEPLFASEYRRARREAFGQAIALVQRYATMAVNVMVRVMADTASPPPSRVAAAAAILRFGREGIELDDLAARIDALERASEQPPQSHRWGG